jgi:hypothetical protein
MIMMIILLTVHIMVRSKYPEGCKPFVTRGPNHEVGGEKDWQNHEGGILRL